MTIESYLLGMAGFITYEAYRIYRIKFVDNKSVKYAVSDILIVFILILSAGVISGWLSDGVLKSSYFIGLTFVTTLESITSINKYSANTDKKTVIDDIAGEVKQFGPVRSAIYKYFLRL